MSQLITSELGSLLFAELLTVYRVKVNLTGFFVVMVI